MKHLIISILFFIAQNAFSSTDVQAVPGEFLVSFRTHLSEASVQFAFNQLESYGLFPSHRLPDSEIYLFKQKSLSYMAPDNFQTILTNVPEVEDIEPNLIFSVSKVPSDPQYARQWGLKNTGLNNLAANAVKGIDINIEPAWDMITGSQKIVVAIVDSGINYKHPDLKNNIWINTAEKNGKAGVDDDKNGFVDDVFGYDFANSKPNAMDDLGHGSHCAGIIGATGNNQSGITGINWQIRMMPVKFLNKNGKGTLEKAINAINYAAKNGAQIINASWGSTGTSSFMEKTIAKLYEKNILFVAAAGNESSDNDKKKVIPASITSPNLLSVAAIDNGGKLASFSNYGVKSVHIGAPGVRIFSTVLDDKYEYMSGTSMAAPFISGISALLLAHNPKLKPSEIRNKLLNTATPLDQLKNKVSSFGMVNTLGALTK